MRVQGSYRLPPDPPAMSAALKMNCPHCTMGALGGNDLHLVPKLHLGTH